MEQGRDALGGSLAGWNPDYPITVANEATMPRAWRGLIHRIAVYDRALTAAEIAELAAAAP